MSAAADVSLGKQEPPKPGPGRRNRGPIRGSRPMPVATSWTSAPISSQSRAISLMKEILTARKPLDAYLMSSAEATSVMTKGVSRRKSGL